MRKMRMAFATVLGLTVLAPCAMAADSERAERWQFSFPITFTSGANYSGDGNTKVDINDDVGWGLAMGYHVNEHILVGGEFTWIAANYNAFVATDFDNDQIADDSVEVAGTLDATNLQFFGQYNFMTRRFTPFVRASFGWTWVDSNIPSGPATGTCWWDPWYGYVCGTWQPTFEDTAFAYGAAAGVRAELTDKFFVEGSYNLLWIDFNKAGTQDLDGIRVNMGWLF